MDDIISGQNNLRNALTSCDDPLKGEKHSFNLEEMVFNFRIF